MPVDITATKPASQPGNPSWATNGGTRVAPTLGQKQTGWTNAQRPPFNVFNWILGFLSDWTKYAEDATDELDSGKLSRKGAGASTPQGMIGTLSSERDGVDDCGATTTRWATVWTYFLNVATEILLSATALIVATRIVLDATADTLATARKNSITTRSMTKALAFIEITTGGIVQVLDGFGINNGTNPPIAENDFGHAGDGGNFTITWATAFANTSYQTIAQVEFDANSFLFLCEPLSIHGDGGAHLKVAGKQTFKLYNRATGAAIDFSTTGPGVPVAPIFITIYAHGLQ